MMQSERPIEDEPEIRVWCHPHYIDQKGDDYYCKFKSFTAALKFIKEHKEAEDQPLIAFKGYELNIFALENIKPETRP